MSRGTARPRGETAAGPRVLLRALCYAARVAICAVAEIVLVLTVEQETGTLGRDTAAQLVIGLGSGALWITVLRLW